jgi:hypothetical protein
MQEHRYHRPWPSKGITFEKRSQGINSLTQPAHRNPSRKDASLPALKAVWKVLLVKCLRPHNLMAQPRRKTHFLSACLETFPREGFGAPLKSYFSRSLLLVTRQIECYSFLKPLLSTC